MYMGGIGHYVHGYWPQRSGQRQSVNQCIVNSICGAILKIVTFFKDGKLCKALSKQSITEELLKSGFSPTVQSTTWLYEALDKF